jgi:hypothetical protein
MERVVITAVGNSVILQSYTYEASGVRQPHSPPKGYSGCVPNYTYTMEIYQKQKDTTVN